MTRTPPNIVVLGAGGVATACVRKLVQYRDEFGSIAVASRTGGRARQLAGDLHWRNGAPGQQRVVDAVELDARDVDATARLLDARDADLVLNMAAPYTNMPVMRACLKAGASYLDTAIAETEGVEPGAAPWYAANEWTLQHDFDDAGLSAFLGLGFDPGVVNVQVAAAAQHMDTVDAIDIIDVNGGDHGRWFATNFDPDVNLREIGAPVQHVNDGVWQTIPHHSRSMRVTLPDVGEHTVWAMGHDELHSLPTHFPTAQRVMFWMGFGERYLRVFEVLHRLGLTSGEPIDVPGGRVRPVDVVKTLLPDPVDLAAGYTGKVVIGSDVRGRTAAGAARRMFVWSTVAHEDAFDDIRTQAVSYTAGVPPVALARLFAADADGFRPGQMVHAEQLPPRPYLDMLADCGIATEVRELPIDGSWPWAEEAS